MTVPFGACGHLLIAVGAGAPLDNALKHTQNNNYESGEAVAAAAWETVRNSV
jgi:hypothetical protein